MRAGDVVLPRKRLRYVVEFTPSSWLSRVALEGFVGEEAETDERDASFEGSVLFAYKLNWQTVSSSATATIARCPMKRCSSAPIASFS